MSLRALVVAPLCEPVPPQWDAFVGEQGLVGLWRASLLTTSAWCAHAPTVMATVVDGADHPVALFHGRLLGLPARVRRFVTPGAAPAFGGVECRLHPIASLCGHAFAADLDPPGRREATAAFEREVRARWGARRAAIAYRQVPEADVEVLAGRWRPRIAVQPEMVLDNRWADVPAYLASLPAKWRSQLRRISETIDADPSVRVDVEASLPGAEAAWLVQTVRARYQRRSWARPPVPVRYLELLNESPDTRFVTYRDGGGRLLAFSTAHDDGTELVLTFWGTRDAAAGGRPNLYFDQYLRLVGMMISGQRRALRMGKGMSPIKARYGASPAPRWAVAGWG